MSRNKTNCVYNFHCTFENNPMDKEMIMYVPDRRGNIVKLHIKTTKTSLLKEKVYSVTNKSDFFLKSVL